MTEWFNVGKIVNTHGIHGEVRVISRTDFPDERYAQGSVLYAGEDRQADKQAVTVESHRRHKQFDLLKFKALDGINAVLPLKGQTLYVTEEALTALPEDEYYYHEIVGCEVYSDTGICLGKVKEILSPGANDVWVVDRKGKKDVLLPYIEEVVKQVDVQAKRITVHLMEGLIDDAD
ncbi:ribosome maturation factor RimM [Pullulanibacillus camelliae]|uniref:Ribosome maturation factor RimM n=1 Tax=Pullulanibacillus camelliae TaxID=1707096 RepID=A0A8J2YH93_9BACL|nr:ribosome maturation factor RimM [Pullulanibacillus camelliae]GGE41987.1 ribosome maturation factor RimM [Pullulanibacillus camelliae]